MALEEFKGFDAIFFHDGVQYFLMGFNGVMRRSEIHNTAASQIFVNRIDGFL